MYFKNKISTNVPLERREKGFIEKYLPFLVEVFGKKDTRILPILTKIGQSLGDVGMNDEFSVEVNGTPVFVSRFSGNSFQQSLNLVRGYDKTIRKVHLVGRKKENSLEITSVINIELLSDKDIASVTIENHGMVQIPESVKAKTFEKDIQDILKKGYLENCEKDFAKFTDSMIRGFRNAFHAKLAASKTEKTIVVPAKKDMKTSKFYNREFSKKKTEYVLRNFTVLPEAVLIIAIRAIPTLSKYIGG